MTQVSVDTLINTRIGSGIEVTVSSTVESGGVRKFLVLMCDEDGEISSKEFSKLSKAIDHYSGMLKTDFAGSIYVTECEDEKAFEPYK